MLENFLLRVNKMYQPRPLEIEIGASFDPRMDAVVKIARQIEAECDGVVFYAKDEEGALTSIEIADTFAFSEDRSKLIVLNVSTQRKLDSDQEEVLLAKILEVDRSSLEERIIAQGSVTRDILYGFVSNAQTISAKVSVGDIAFAIDTSAKQTERFRARQRLHQAAPNLLSFASHIKPMTKATKPEVKGSHPELSL